MLQYLPSETERPSADPPRPCLFVAGAELDVLRREPAGTDRPARPVLGECATPAGPRRNVLGLARSPTEAWDVVAHGRIRDDLNPIGRVPAAVAVPAVRPCPAIVLRWCRIASITAPRDEFAVRAWICVAEACGPASHQGPAAEA